MKQSLILKDFLEDNLLKFQAFGVKIGIEAEATTHLEKVFELLEKVFPNGLEKTCEREIEFHFRIAPKKRKKLDFYLNDEKVIENTSEEAFYGLVESQIRITIAEFAVGKVFLHAGVVGWKGHAIVIPATSFSGKTTLVAALVKKGALYYSDEYAVLDSSGNVEPFPKWLSLRGIIDSYTQMDCSVESIGGVAGKETIPVGMVLIAKYKEEKKIPKIWKPRRLSDGQGIMEILKHTLPIRNKPEFVLEILNKVARRAIIIKTIRGEADEFAELLLKYFESPPD